MNLAPQEYCTGCAACMQICHKAAIFMKEDKEGFLYPEIDNSICVNCGLCQKVCPVQLPSLPQNTSKDIQAYAAVNPNGAERLQSSSGGIFITLAKKVLAEQGVVFGAVFDENFEVHHTCARSLEELKPMLGSKYLQSRIENCFIEAEKLLKQQVKVLFSGTPCQIMGLKSYLRKDYNNLLTVDLICHGVPSPAVWRQYLREFCSKEKLEKITNVNFRNKCEGWRRFHLYTSGIFQGKDSINAKNYFTFFGEDPYMRGFLSDIYLRPSCYNCHAKNGRSCSDITIADFWGIQNVLPSFDDDRGTTLLLVNSDKGKAAVSAVNIHKQDVQVVDALRHNSAYYVSAAPHPRRDYFFKKFKQGMPIDNLVLRCTSVPVYRRVLIKLKMLLRRIIK